MFNAIFNGTPPSTSQVISEIKELGNGFHLADLVERISMEMLESIHTRGDYDFELMEKHKLLMLMRDLCLSLAQDEVKVEVIEEESLLLEAD